MEEKDYEALRQIANLAQSDMIGKQMTAHMNQVIQDMVIPGQELPKKSTSEKKDHED